MEQNHGGYGLINKSISEAVLEAALRTGGDFSELYMQDTEFNTVKMVDGAVDNASYERKAGAGVRVLKGTRSAYAYTANTSESALIAAAKAAASALNEAKEFEAKSVCVERIGGYEQKIPFSTIKMQIESRFCAAVQQQQRPIQTKSLRLLRRIWIATIALRSATAMAFMPRIVGREQG